jgi:hypothetical protein
VYAGNMNFTAAAAASSLTVVDTTRPAIGTMSASPNVLGPSNHRMINVVVAYTASDTSGAPVCAMTVTSNEPVNGEEDGNTAIDWIVIDAHHVQLRAERAGDGNGRIYTVTATCVDGAGNASAKSTTVSVPK